MWGLARADAADAAVAPAHVAALLLMMCHIRAHAAALGSAGARAADAPAAADADAVDVPAQSHDRALDDDMLVLQIVRRLMLTIPHMLPLMLLLSLMWMSAMLVILHQLPCLLPLLLISMLMILLLRLLLQLPLLLLTMLAII